MAARPLYESARNRENEQETANLIALKRGLRAYKLPPKFPLDFALLDAQKTVKAWLEIKCREVTFSTYADYMIAVSKLGAMIDLQRNTCTPAFLAIKWTDKLGILALPVTFDVRIGGRADRGDPQDFEPVAHIALDHFEIIYDFAELTP